MKILLRNTTASLVLFASLSLPALAANSRACSSLAHQENTLTDRMTEYALNHPIATYAVADIVDGLNGFLDQHASSALTSGFVGWPYCLFVDPTGCDSAIAFYTPRLLLMGSIVQQKRQNGCAP